jgi:predicted DNA-binding transcriptional regulator YafY
MNPAERILRIHRELKPGKRITFGRLREVLEVSEATLKRDIAYMRDFMDAPILNERDGSGYWYDPDALEFELPGLWFNDSELYALLASEQLLEAVQPGLLTPYIGPLRSRIRKLLEQSGHSADTVTSRVRLQAAARRPVDAQRFGTIAGAVLNGRILDIEYHGREKGLATSRRVHPQRLLHYRDNWYLIAWCEQAQDLRTFSLDRIRPLDTPTAPAKMLPDSDIDRVVGATFGIFTGEASGWAILRFTPHAARWVSDETWHPDQVGRWVDGVYELQVPYSDDRELLMDILKYGPDVEVIAPAELRALVAQRVRETQARYE